MHSRGVAPDLGFVEVLSLHRHNVYGPAMARLVRLFAAHRKAVVLQLGDQRLPGEFIELGVGADRFAGSRIMR